MWRYIAWATGIGFVLLMYGVIDPASGLLPSCPFYIITDLYCPGCGSQRALHALIHGNVTQALGYNPLFIMALLYLLAEGILAIWAVTGRKMISLASRRYTPHIVLIVVSVFWVLRNIGITPFHMLAP